MYQYIEIPNSIFFFLITDDICDPEEFECNDCPNMMCQFVYEKNIFGDWKTYYNLFAFFWTMEFVTALGEFVLASTFSQW